MSQQPCTYQFWQMLLGYFKKIRTASTLCPVRISGTVAACSEQQIIFSSLLCIHSLIAQTAHREEGLLALKDSVPFLRPFWIPRPGFFWGPEVLSLGAFGGALGFTARPCPDCRLFGRPADALTAFWLFLDSSGASSADSSVLQASTFWSPSLCLKDKLLQQHHLMCNMHLQVNATVREPGHQTARAVRHGWFGDG